MLACAHGAYMPKGNYLTGYEVCVIIRLVFLIRCFGRCEAASERAR
ncbi:hypothetical protein APHCRT_1539 [Anaplasma phagocytophilum str. CRT53-1]|uniref:Uncharacterized protein n=1 Tax=Anaplasma phagocytophilum str. CRT53-1 TaxID=1359157 RepID=A0A0F3PL52_ANAPH|nr:hypothetical protein APHCRT_1539 [Anaplasma phagocytophilum str. CRT53-1]